MLTADRPPAVVIIDYQQPRQNGAWLAASIHAANAPPASLILLTSLALTLASDDMRLMDRVIAKPAKAAVLIQAIARLTGNARVPAQSHSPTGLKPMFSDLRVLVAEDNIVNQKLALRLLQRMGAKVTLAGNGVEALAALRDADGDREFARDLIGAFVTSATESMEHLIAAVRGGKEATVWRRLAHSIKGSAASASAVAIARAAGELEGLAVEADCRVAIDALSSAFDATLREWEHSGWTASGEASATTATQGL